MPLLNENEASSVSAGEPLRLPRQRLLVRACQEQVRVVSTDTELRLHAGAERVDSPLRLISAGLHLGDQVAVGGAGRVLPVEIRAVGQQVLAQRMERRLVRPLVVEQAFGARDRFGGREVGHYCPCSTFLATLGAEVSP